MNISEQLKIKFKNSLKSWQKRLTEEEKIWLEAELNKNANSYKNKLFNVLKILVNGCAQCKCGKVLSIYNTLTGAKYCSKECQLKYKKINTQNSVLKKYRSITCFSVGFC